MIGLARSFSLAVLAGAVLSACSWHDAESPAQAESYQFRAPPASGVGRTVVDTATSMLGAPYRYGGSGPRAFDCSGLVLYSYLAAGIDVPRTSAQQFGAARPVAIDDAQPGDLVFFRFSRKVSHVGIYLGDGRFVHAPQTGDRVSIESLQHPYYRDGFVSAGRMY